MSTPALSHTSQKALATAQPPAIVKAAQEQLGRSRYRAVRDVTCIASGRAVYLHGCLPSQYLKQIAQETVLGVEGMIQLINRIKVSPPSSLARLNRPAEGESSN
jgi:osmotically-inducible protein OsmY